MIWDKVKAELDRAGRAAQQALDEGKLRLELHRARARADRAAQRLGYGLYRARQTGGDIAPAEYLSLSTELTAAETDAGRIQQLLDEAAGRRRGASTADGPTMSEPQPPV